jgi:RNA polymerase sigma factor (sigma-70 family)
MVVPDDDEELRAALRSLPPRMRTAVVLRFYADLSEQQAAEAMGCSPSTVNTQTARGLARLRSALGSRALTSEEQR